MRPVHPLRAPKRRSRPEPDLPPLDVRVERLAAGGDGVARAPDGRVVFVPFAAPGDLLRVRVVEARKSFLRARIEAVLEPGSSRVEPPCPAYGRCGGCAWQHVSQAAQLEAKHELLRDALVRIGRLELPGPLRVQAAESGYGYRGRARLLARGGRVGFRRLGSDSPWVTEECPILLPSLEEARARLVAEEPPDGEWELAAGDDGAARCHDLAVRGGPAIEIAAPGSAVGLRVSPGVFLQAHATLRSALGEAAVGAAGRGERALELYAGAGFLTLGLAERFGQVEAVESHAAAVHDLRENLRRAGARHVRVARERAEVWLARESLPRFDVVVVDPPRTGLQNGTPDRLLRTGPARLVYVSCDPATLARDLALFVAGGYRLAHVEGFDLFPQTPHVEALAVLQR